MSRFRLHPEHHLVDRIGWLRAAVLGANDGILSTASLIIGVAAAAATQSDVLIAGVAGLVAGAMSMAAGEYVSVSSQSDTERADLARERQELSDNPEFELDELADIYVKRGSIGSLRGKSPGSSWPKMPLPLMRAMSLAFRRAPPPAPSKPH
jgi:vacuolar iron transporter family protein